MKRKKLRKIWLVIPILLIILLAYPIYLTVSITSKNYELGSVIPIITKGVKDDVQKNGYSKTLEVAVNDSNFDKNNVASYFKINYQNKNNFIEKINKLLKVGYTETDINLINEKITDDIVETLYEHELIKDIASYLQFDYFKSKNLYRYIDYYVGDYKEAVVSVNIGLDKELYEDVNIIKNFSTNVLVNKYNKLDESFEPSNITEIKAAYTKGSGKQYLSRVAQVAFEEMCEAALSDGKYLLANSAYRSYNDQQEIYNTYLNLYGQNYVDNYVAIPGYSEHQTGLALDVAAKGYNTFKTSPEYNWMLENSYKYGFILRYPEEKQNITGYKYEAWHFRYVGVDVAAYIKENNITYEEYYVMFLDK